MTDDVGVTTGAASRAETDGPPLARVIIVSGPSGSGKSRLGRQLSAAHGWPFVNLDDFYKDVDDPSLPRLASGEIDWDDAGTWNVGAAASALEALCRTGRAAVPTYSIALSRAEGSRDVVLDGASFVVAEGIFAPDVIEELSSRGVLEAAWCLRRNRSVTAARRLVRDLAERRKPPAVLLRRGARLWRQEPSLMAAHVARGAEPVSFRDAVSRAGTIAATTVASAS